MKLRTSDLGARVGLSPATVRYYESLGLLPAPERSEGGYRLYHEGEVDRLRFIKGAQRFGLRLREIRELLEVRDRGACPCGHTQTLVTRRIAEVEQEISRLQALHKELMDMEARHPKEPRPHRGPNGWPCEVEFIDAGR
jgi:DNA-binding transcriptional MerR regulator